MDSIRPVKNWRQLYTNSYMEAILNKKAEPTQVVAVRLTARERERLAALATMRGESISDFARRALHAAMAVEVSHAGATA